ncbi:MAG: DUF898 family protein [Proteobacteria bacterium]|nr:DUF898 family protein [Pseudomonadota bacterium]
MTTILILLTATLFVGMPVACAFGLSSIFALMYDGYGLLNVASRMFAGLDSFVLLAAPFYILAGEIMNRGGISERLIELSRILIGRIIVLAIILGYNIVANLFPVFSLVLTPVFLLALPWFVMRGLRFNARVTSYRNIRFDFTGGYWGAFKAYVLGSIITWLSLGILAPIASRWMWHYLLSNATYGGRPVTNEATVRAMYGQWLLPAVIFLGGLVLFGASAFAILPALQELYSDISASADADLVLAVIIQLLLTSLLPLIVLLAFAGLIYRAGTRNVAFNATLIDGRHKLMSFIHRGRFAWVTVSNLVATILTLGLARPWAAVRMAKLMAVSTALEVEGSLDGYIGQIVDSGPAVASEYLDVEGFDIGF